jgi:hypothetical protein
MNRLQLSGWVRAEQSLMNSLLACGHWQPVTNHAPQMAIDMVTKSWLSVEMIVCGGMLLVRKTHPTMLLLRPAAKP